jgi:hypothetical protein
MRVIAATQRGQAMNNRTKILVIDAEQKEEKGKLQETDGRENRGTGQEARWVKVKAAGLKGDARKEFSKEMTGFRKKQTVAKEKWKELKSAGARTEKGKIRSVRNGSESGELL